MAAPARSRSRSLNSVRSAAEAPDPENLEAPIVVEQHPPDLGAADFDPDELLAEPSPPSPPKPELPPGRLEEIKRNLKRIRHIREERSQRVSRNPPKGPRVAKNPPKKNKRALRQFLDLQAERRDYDSDNPEGDSYKGGNASSGSDHSEKPTEEDKKMIDDTEYPAYPPPHFSDNEDEDSSGMEFVDPSTIDITKDVFLAPPSEDEVRYLSSMSEAESRAGNVKGEIRGRKLLKTGRKARASYPEKVHTRDTKAKPVPPVVLSESECDFGISTYTPEETQNFCSLADVYDAKTDSSRIIKYARSYFKGLGEDAYLERFTEETVALGHAVLKYHHYRESLNLEVSNYGRSPAETNKLREQLTSGIGVTNFFSHRFNKEPTLRTFFPSHHIGIQAVTAIPICEQAVSEIKKELIPLDSIHGMTSYTYRVRQWREMRDELIRASSSGQDRKAEGMIADLNAREWQQNYSWDLVSFHDFCQRNEAELKEQYSPVFDKLKENQQRVDHILNVLNRIGQGSIAVIPSVAFDFAFHTGSLMATKVLMSVCFGDHSIPTKAPWVSIFNLKKCHILLFCSAYNTDFKCHIVSLFAPKIFKSVIDLCASFISVFIPGDFKMQVYTIPDTSPFFIDAITIELAYGIYARGINLEDETVRRGLYSVPAVWPNPLRFIPTANLKLRIELPQTFTSTRNKNIHKSELISDFGYSPSSSAFVKKAIIDILQIKPRKIADTQLNEFEQCALLNYVTSFSMCTNSFVVFGVGSNYVTCSRGFIFDNSLEFDVPYDRIEFAFSIYNETEPGFEVNHNPCYWSDNARVNTPWSLTFFGTGSLYINPDLFRGASLSLDAVNGKCTFRPMLFAMLNSTLQLKHIEHAVRNMLRNFKVQFHKGPPILKDFCSKSLKPPTPWHAILDYMTEMTPGLSLTDAIDQMPTELSHLCYLNIERAKSIYALKARQPPKPPMEFKPFPLPFDFYNKAQVAMCTWMLSLQNKKASGDGYNLFLSGETAFGKTSFVSFLKRHCHVTQIMSQNHGFYTGVTKFTEIIVFDDVDDISKYPDLLSIMDNNFGEKNINIKHSHVVLTHPVRLVFCTNKRFDEYWSSKCEEERMALRRKCAIADFRTWQTTTRKGVKMRYKWNEYYADVVVQASIPYGFRFYDAPRHDSAVTYNFATKTLEYHGTEVIAGTNMCEIKSDFQAIWYKERPTDPTPILVYEQTQLEEWSVVVEDNEEIAKKKDMAELRSIIPRIARGETAMVGFVHRKLPNIAQFLEVCKGENWLLAAAMMEKELDRLDNIDYQAAKRR